MSISKATRRPNRFDDWVVQAYEDLGAFTALVILVDIDDKNIMPLCSTYLSVIGEEVNWNDITILFAGAGADWKAASFFPVTGPSGNPLDNPTARLRLRELEQRVDDDKLVLNEGHFFDKWGRRMSVEEVGA